VVRTVIACVLVTACGRLHFDPVGNGDGGAGGDGGGGDSDGAVTVPGAVTIALSSAGLCPALAWSGSSLGVVWLDRLSPSGFAVRWAGYDLTGQLVEGPLTIGSGMTSADCSAIVWTGSEFLVASAFNGTSGRYDVFTATVSGGTASAPTNVVGDSSQSYEPALAIAGGQVVVAWQDITGTKDNVMARPLSATGAPTQPAYMVSGLAGVNTSPFVVAVPGGFAAVWLGDAAPRVLALDATGAVSGTEKVISGQSVDGVGAAATGSDVLGSWCDLSGALTTARFDAAGTLTSGPFASSSTLPCDLAVPASSGSDGRVVYVGSDSGAYPIHLATLAATGEVVADTAMADGTIASTLAIAWAGDRYAAVFDNNGGAWLTVLPP
jgi:hypothetical protein